MASKSKTRSLSSHPEPAATHNIPTVIMPQAAPPPAVPEPPCSKNSKPRSERRGKKRKHNIAVKSACLNCRKSKETLRPFLLERFFAKHEFKSPQGLLCCSDPEPLTMKQLLELADPVVRELWDNLSLGYTESQGLPLLRTEISKMYKHITPEDVLVCTPEEGIFVAMRSLLQKGDHVIVTFPAYQSLYEVATFQGCDVTKWPLKARPCSRRKGPLQWELDLDFLTTHVQPRTRLIVINFPHNPTGAVLTHLQLAQVLQFAKKHNIYVFSDEMYHFLEHGLAAPVNFACDLYKRAVSLFGVSKSFALPGLRIGWLATRDEELLKRMLSYKDFTTICSSAPSEVLAVIALRNRATLIQRSLQIVRQNLPLARAFFEKHHSLFEWVEPHGGTTAFPRVVGGMDAMELCMFIREHTGILLLPSDVFECPQHVRIGLGRKNFAALLQKLDEFLSKLHHAQSETHDVMPTALAALPMQDMPSLVFERVYPHTPLLLPPFPPTEPEPPALPHLMAPSLEDPKPQT